MIHDHPLAYARGSAAGLFVAPHQSQRCGTDKTPPAKSVMRPAPIRFTGSFFHDSVVGWRYNNHPVNLFPPAGHVVSRRKNHG